MASDHGSFDADDWRFLRADHQYLSVKIDLDYHVVGRMIEHSREEYLSDYLWKGGNAVHTELWHRQLMDVGRMSSLVYFYGSSSKKNDRWTKNRDSKKLNRWDSDPTPKICTNSENINEYA